MAASGTPALYTYAARTRRRKLPDGGVEVSVRRLSFWRDRKLFHPSAEEMAAIRAELAAGRSHIEVARAWSIGSGRDSQRLRRLLAKYPSPEAVEEKDDEEEEDGESSEPGA